MMGTLSLCPSYAYSRRRVGTAHHVARKSTRDGSRYRSTHPDKSMQNYLSLLRNLAIGLALAVATLSANAGYSCWVVKVKKSEAGVQVFMRDHYHDALQRITQKNSTAKEQPQIKIAPSEFFELREGDVADLRGGAHDWCTITATTLENSFGIQIEAFSRPHGRPLSTFSEFVAAE